MWSQWIAFACVRLSRALHKARLNRKNLEAGGVSALQRKIFRQEEFLPCKEKYSGRRSLCLAKKNPTRLDSCPALWGHFTKIGLHKTHKPSQTPATYLRFGTEREVAPWYNWRGRPILYSGSEIISFHWAIQPTVRAKAKIAVNKAVGTPIAR